MSTLSSYFKEEDDPRKSNAPRHKFCDLMTISLLCALCGGEPKFICYTTLPDGLTFCAGIDRRDRF
jgi:hypothetical protein